MENKELDVLLVEGKDNDGFTLKFTLRGGSVKQLKEKLVQLKSEWFGDLTPVTSSYDKKPQQSPVVSKSATPSTAHTPGDYGTCKKCGAPNKWSVNKNKPYCGAMCWKNGEKTY